jgi:hypothetical protein
MDIPIELFLGFTGLSIALALFGFCRNPQIPATIVMGGMFILFLAVSTDNVIMGKIPVTSVDSGATTTYTFIDNTFEFTDMPKVIFALLGVMCMVLGGLMVMRN